MICILKSNETGGSGILPSCSGGFGAGMQVEKNALEFGGISKFMFGCKRFPTYLYVFPY